MKIWPNLEEIYSKTRHYVCVNGLCGDKDHPTIPTINASLRPRTSLFTEKTLEILLLKPQTIYQPLILPLISDPL